MAVGCHSVTWNPDAPIRAYHSSERAERAFCSVCGSNLYWRGLNDDMSEQVIALMAFDRPEAFPITRQIYLEEKPATYALALPEPLQERFA
jgi:hypothetical protein